jgi:hypothetical protein
MSQQIFELNISQIQLYADHSLPTSACEGVGPEYAMLLWLISVDKSVFSGPEN